MKRSITKPSKPARASNDGKPDIPITFSITNPFLKETLRALGKGTQIGTVPWPQEGSDNL